MIAPDAPCFVVAMAMGEMQRQIEERLHEAASGTYLGQRALVTKAFVGDFDNDKLLRMVVKLFEGISESFAQLAQEVDDLGDRVAALEGGG